ncbi:unnamed protein product [Didymodactylos carnosus]|uniref:Uncharacterized protein n=1 Tax=Didymodactylos carnosus TaxID=1234261 RepID=A0A8S2GWL8_9BILA|nr:unnamed protein product [Didymodactylos carnosus]CAF3569492.1 unnamed protein product [Didymodactylos carnosus]
MAYAVKDKNKFQNKFLSTSTEQELLRDLLHNYEPAVRPVYNAQSVVTIDFRMDITQLFELEEKTQILTTNVRIEQKWRDEALGWNQTEYQGVRGIRLPSHRIWLPDSNHSIVLFISAFDLSSDSPGAYQGVVSGPYVMVYSNGDVMYPVLMKLRTSCKFASWIYDVSSIHYELLATNKNDQTESIRNSGWQIMNVEQGRVWRSKNNKTYGELVYGVHIKRRPLYYVFNVIIPCAMLSALTCMSFWLPTSSGEKVTLGLTCFVAFSVFMLMVAEKVPATSDTIPIIGIYLTIVMSLTSISVIMAVVVSNIHSQAAICTTERHKAPAWLVDLALVKLPRLLKMKEKVKDVLNQKRVYMEDPLTSESSQMPLSATKNELDINYEHMIENLLLQQVLLYTKHRPNPSELNFHSKNSHDDSLWIRQSHRSKNRNRFVKLARDKLDGDDVDELLVLTPCKQRLTSFALLNINSSSSTDNDSEQQQQFRQLETIHNYCVHSEEPSLCLVEKQKVDKKTEQEANSSDIIDYILKQFHSTSAQSSFDDDQLDNNLVHLIKERNSQKRTNSSTSSDAFYFRLQWLTIALVIDRFFFWTYFCATLISYIITLWLIPISHPKLIIDITTL